MARKIERGALGPRLLADQAAQHPDDLRAFLVDRRGIEIVDLDIAIGAHRMGERPLILAELPRAQREHIVDPLHRALADIGGEGLIAVDCQPLFEAKLEPVAAGDPVARPVVEILMPDHRLDAFIIQIGRGFGGGEHQLGVENVQPLVLHRAHIEIIDGDNVENVQVIGAAPDPLIPFH